MALKSFISEKEIEEVKKKRQEEWERVRKPDQPLQRPEDEYDNRTLYEKLKAQKDKKQEEWEEQFKFKNMIYKGLDEDESTFLQFVADRQAERDDELVREEIKEVSAYRVTVKFYGLHSPTQDAVAQLQEEVSKDLAPQSTSSEPQSDSGVNPTQILGTAPAKAQKSQLSLIAGSIKTKRKRDSRSAKSRETRSSSLDKEGERTAKAAASPEKKLKLEMKDHGTADNATPTRHGAVTVLPGLAAYSSDSSEPED